MMRRKFCCEDSRRDYENYYTAQSGNGLPVFRGYPGQRGHGLGSILGGLWRRALPFLKQGLAFFGKQALNTGSQIATDVSAGKNVVDSVKERVSEKINEYVPGFLSQTGTGRRRRRTRKTKRRITKRFKKDIFD